MDVFFICSRSSSSLTKCDVSEVQVRTEQPKIDHDNLFAVHVGLDLEMLL